MALPVTFATQVTPVALSGLDTNFNALGALVPIPCSLSGTNALALSPLNNTPAVTAYQNYMQFVAIAQATNTTAVTAAVGSLAPLSVFRDSPGGPIALTGGEILGGNAITLIYDSVINGFHLQTGPLILNLNTLTVGANPAYLTRILSRQATITHTIIGIGTTQDQLATLAGLQAADQVMVAPPATCASVVGLVYTAYAAAAGTVAIRASNISAGSITPPASQVFRITALGFV
jgi:hypothetical protein